MKGCLLVNLGTPDAPTVPAVRRYLREFLMDPRVVDLPWLVRALLVYLVILPFRPKRSAHAYAKVWDASRGSPLMFHTRDLADALGAALGDTWKVAVGMRYGAPSITAGLADLADCDDVVVVPLFPQYAEATSGSVIAALADAGGVAPRVRVVRSFHVDDGWVDAVAASIRPHLRPESQLILSYHGLPERQVRRADPTGRHCLADAACCETPSPAHPTCYRAQCRQGASAIARRLDLPDDAVLVAFQSRLGRDAWLAPSTESIVRANAGRDVVIACPSFPTDCLETLEEVGLGLRDVHGSGRFDVVPCLNADPAWVAALARIVTSA
jgi:ferrochelatase